MTPALALYTLCHVLLSLAGLLAGLVVAGAFVSGKRLDFFVLVAQLFFRLPALIAAAPTQKEPPFVAAQMVVLALFVWLGTAAVKGFRGAGAAVGATVHA
jgi:hypothetical protein